MYPLPLRYTGPICIQDPLSALDAHVGEAVFNDVLLDNASSSTRLLVTHALHFLPRVDYIYFIVGGCITERGTFDEMMANRGNFARTFDEFVTKGQQESKDENVVNIEGVDFDENVKKRKNATRGAQLMQAEERNIGAVNLEVYKQYFRSGNGAVLLPTMVLALILMQASTVISTYWCVITLVYI